MILKKVSIICITYKRPYLLEEAIHSVLQQTYKNIELIVINDCPNHKLYLNNSSVRIYNLDKKFYTIGEKRNFGISKCNGDIMMFLDDDDIILPKYIEYIVKKIYKSSLLKGQKVILFDGKNPILSSRSIKSTMVFTNKNVLFQSVNNSEYNNFFSECARMGSTLYSVLGNEEFGYIKRRNVSSYSVSRLHQKTQEEFDEIMKSQEFVSGNIELYPKWNEDYESIIKSNISFEESDTFSKNIINKLPPPKNKITNAVSGWQKVKNTWENADKFLSAIKSRGLVSSALNILNVNNEGGERVSPEILERRKLSCFGDDKLPVCNQLRKTENEEYFCGACGCGKNKLAILNSNEENGYTKLHYPYLECPLKKPGFSNYEEGLLSIVITSLNEDPTTLNNTVSSIRDTSNNVEIIVVDDASDNIVSVNDKETIVTRNSERIGCAPSRHKGASLAKNKYLLFTDSHMVFSSGWYDHFTKRIENEKENVVFCGMCLGLDKNHLTLDKHRGKYCGARLSLYEEKENQVLEGKWISEKSEEEYEISCMMGAIYIINKNYFFKLRGLSDLKMWGSDEPCLALKILQSGGKMLLVKGISAGHIFRDEAPYATNLSYLIYNKIRMAKTMLPDELGNKLINKLPKDGNYFAAMEMINIEKETIKEYKNYYHSIFSVSVDEICEKFRIKTSC